MTILSTEQITQLSPTFWLSIIFFIILSVIIIAILLLGEWYNEKSIFCYLIFIVIIWILFAASVFHEEKNPIDTGRERYIVTFENDEAAELFEKYKLIEKKDKVWILEDRNEK